MRCHEFWAKYLECNDSPTPRSLDRDLTEHLAACAACRAEAQALEELDVILRRGLVAQAVAWRVTHWMWAVAVGTYFVAGLVLLGSTLTLPAVRSGSLVRSLASRLRRRHWELCAWPMRRWSGHCAPFL